MPLKVAREAMRTRFEVLLADDRDPVSLRAAAEAALDEVDRVEAELSIFRMDSVLAEVNAAAAQRPVLLDATMFGFLAHVGGLVEAVGGAFDPTVGPLLRLLRAPQEPSPEALSRACGLVGFSRQVELDAAASTVRFRTPGVRLDPGAVGKGWALDRAAALLRELGIGSALLHGGTSSVYAVGAPPGAQGWSVAIADPAQPGTELTRIVLRDQALGVSAPHGRVFQQGRGHVLDPRTGRSVDQVSLAAAVMPSATDADAVSTALLVLGAAALDSLAGGFSGASFLVASPQAGDLQVDVIGEAF